MTEYDMTIEKMKNEGWIKKGFDPWDWLFHRHCKAEIHFTKQIHRKCGCVAYTEHAFLCPCCGLMKTGSEIGWI